MSRITVVICSFSLILLACGELPEAPEVSVESSGQSAALAAGRSSDHGPLAFADALPLALDRSTAEHVFHLTLSATARVELRTAEDATGGMVDTVLTLERESSGRLIARNDDDGRSRFSRLARELPAGAYRLRVSGFKRSTQGSFLLEAHCSGPGCPAVEPACLFGDSFYALRTEGRVPVLEERWIRALGELTSELEAQQLVIAVQQSSHTDVTTPAEALARVDQNEVRRMRLRAPSDAREYDVFEYGAGDNSYGAIFRADSLTLAASIHDGDLLECSEH
ncbi:MAG TPA: DVUA0089 family protein [Polyangiaceae bacterium]|nr:DVUA0089 family protein [Polyangiaceae bacterium]